jgi:MoaA/NifB/PqqE/SkfB family radical SAM enzyme
MDTIHIVSWLLTRRCNLHCSYCRISRDYKKRPMSYPSLKDYEKNEMLTGDIIGALKILKVHNPNCFHIFYGGEPFLRTDLADIINYCNREAIHYTIITNNSDEVQLAIDDLLLKTEFITGLTSSVDPIVVAGQSVNTDQYKKSIKALERFTKLRNVIQDLVAEITVTRKSVASLYDLVKMLTDMGVNSDITVVDPSKSDFYDFSNVTDREILVPKSQEVYEIFDKIVKNKLDVHMANPLLYEIFSILPSNLDCKIENDVHNLTIDADGKIRLCLRIRGVYTPYNFNTKNFLLDDGNLHPGLRPSLAKDKRSICRNCNWTCMIMSKIVSEVEKYNEKLLHSEKRQY